MFVSEIFGPTIQGEGASMGRHCLFVRLADCNLECTWCDTPYTWAFTENKAAKTETGVRFDRTTNRIEMSTSTIVESLINLWPIYVLPTTIVISGGEPLMQAEALVELAEVLSYKMSNSIHIETAGTLKVPPTLDTHVAQYNVSPKLEHSGNLLSKRFKPEVLSWFAATPRAWFKFVLRSVDDFAQVDKIVTECGIDYNRVMVMPEGITAEQNLSTARLIVDEATRRGYGLSFRAHILLWNDVRGR